MPEDRQGRADRVDAENDGGREPAAVERQHAAPHPGRCEGAEPDQAPERALRRGAAAGVAHIGDHEGHVGDVAGAEQEVAGEIDQHRPDREGGGRRIGDAGGRADRRQQQRNGHGGREQCHRPPHDPPRSRPERLQHERRDQPGCQDADSGTGVEQAEQEVGPLGAAIARWSPPGRRRRRIRPRRQDRPIAGQSSRRQNCRRRRTAPARPRRPAFPSAPKRPAQSAGSGARPAARRPDSRPR